MSKLHNENMEHNDLFIDNIMLCWESDGILKIGVYDWGCTSHMGENVESLWHAKAEEAKENLKKRWWMALELFRVHSRRHQDPPKYYIKEVESFKVGKLAQLCGHGLYVREGYNLQLLDHDPRPLYTVDVGSHIDLVSARCQMQLGHVRWDEPMDCWRFKIKNSIKCVLFFRLPKGVFIDLVGMYH